MSERERERERKKENEKTMIEIFYIKFLINLIIDISPLYNEEVCVVIYQNIF